MLSFLTRIKVNLVMCLNLIRELKVLCLSFILKFIGKLHMQPVGDRMTSSFILLLWEEEVPFEVELIGCVACLISFSEILIIFAFCSWMLVYI